MNENQVLKEVISLKDPSWTWSSSNFHELVSIMLWLPLQNPGQVSFFLARVAQMLWSWPCTGTGLGVMIWEYKVVILTCTNTNWVELTTVALWVRNNRFPWISHCWWICKTCHCRKVPTFLYKRKKKCILTLNLFLYVGFLWYNLHIAKFTCLVLKIEARTWHWGIFPALKDRISACPDRTDSPEHSAHRLTSLRLTLGIT